MTSEDRVVEIKGNPKLSFWENLRQQVRDDDFKWWLKYMGIILLPSIIFITIWWLFLK